MRFGVITVLRASTLRFGLLAAALSALSIAPPPVSAVRAADILETSGVTGGLVVHVGCGNGRLTAGLAGDGFVVEGIDTDPKNVTAAREYIRTKRLTGRVTAKLFDGRRLPYVDNLVNLLVVDEPGDLPADELLRCLAPGGVALAKDGTKTVKPWPDTIGQWTHLFHDPSGNPVSADLEVGPPRSMQWMAGPDWQRSHHHLTTVSALVGAAGRLFYIIDRGPAASVHAPSDWEIVARDGFSGVQLWQRPITSWASVWASGKTGLVQIGRTLVADRERIFLPLGLSEPVTALDAATGDTLITYESTGGAEEIVLHGGILYVVCGSPDVEWAGIEANRGKKPGTKTVVALDPDSGEVLWQRPSTEGYTPCTLAAEAERVFLHEGSSTVALDAKTGRQLWQAEMPVDSFSIKLRKSGWSVVTLQVVDGVVLCSDFNTGRAFAADTGRQLWQRELPQKVQMKNARNIFVVDGTVWIGPDFLEGWDLKTGQTTVDHPAMKDVETLGHHDRCYRFKATSRFIIAGKRGLEFIDLAGDDHSRNNWVRGSCQYGAMPCHGLLYAPPHACGCYMEGKLFGFWALAPERAKRPPTLDERSKPPQLERGPAYNSLIPNPQSPILSFSWPTYRRDVRRSGTTTSALPDDLSTSWNTEIGGRLTAPVVADGRVVVSSVDTHQVVALDAASGSRQWEFIAGGRVDSPPTLYEGRVLFGCTDGFIYCLGLCDGRLAWRFRAAQDDVRTVAREQVESLWPVHGSVLVFDGVAYAAAGRSSYIDGGLTLYALEPTTGEVLHKTRIQSEHPEGTGLPDGKTASEDELRSWVQNTVDSKTFHSADLADGFSMEAARPDVLVSDGSSVYMHHLRFGRSLERQPSYGIHLYSTSSLLDGAESHRSHWVLGGGDFRRLGVAYSWMVNNLGGRYQQRLRHPYGLFLCFNEDRAWGVFKADHDKGNSGFKSGGADRKPYVLFSQRHEPLSTAGVGPDFEPLEKPVPPDWFWSQPLDIHPRAMIAAGEQLLVGGFSLEAELKRPRDAYSGRAGGVLEVVSLSDGDAIKRYTLAAPPVWDGMAVADHRLYISSEGGRVICLGSTH